MALLNFLLSLNAYSDKKSSNSPNLSNFKWIRDIQGIPTERVTSQALTVNPSTPLTVFSGYARKFLYVETMHDVDLNINGGATIINIKPVVINNSKQPGQFLVITGNITSLQIINNESTDFAEVFIATCE